MIYQTLPNFINSFNNKWCNNNNERNKRKETNREAEIVEKYSISSGIVHLFIYSCLCLVYTIGTWSYGIHIGFLKIFVFK